MSLNTNVGIGEDIAAVALPPGIDANTFKGIFGGFPSGVTVVAATDEAGNPVGLTVSAVMSLSLAPPQLLICLQSVKHTLKVIESVGKFSVNFLAMDQSWISDKFAVPAGDKFAELDWVFGGATGAPVIRGVRAYAECEVETLIKSGDHTMVVGHIVAGGIEDVHPLVYHARKYVSLGEHPGNSSESAVRRVVNAR
ncbi:flavin reductase family protein [Paraburkholderia sp. Ac-20340]|uniref:flavin reductase family protein n=1 Tax=Paraburkholderia sp. Ac-20340 TaxID=2703888 RepID=UPI00197CEC1E|nr:flavin reductase family protein [Paraburkholderia sp. Ac-20340]MBN3853970.1 flavin reductase family protein [Paraburkholderia sp. Ac-20340]